MQHQTRAALYARVSTEEQTEGYSIEALKKAEAEFKDMGMDYYLRKAQEVLARVER